MKKKINHKTSDTFDMVSGNLGTISTILYPYKILKLIPRPVTIVTDVLTCLSLGGEIISKVSETNEETILTEQ